MLKSMPSEPRDSDNSFQSLVLELLSRRTYRRYPIVRVQYGRSLQRMKVVGKVPSRHEVLRYFQYVDEKLDLSKDVMLNTRVDGQTLIPSPVDGMSN